MAANQPVILNIIMEDKESWKQKAVNPPALQEFFYSFHFLTDRFFSMNLPAVLLFDK